MAEGGFKAGQFVFSTTVTTSAATMEAEVKNIISGVCALLMSLEPHWGYDANYTATASDFVKIHATTTYRYQAYAQFLVNSSTGSKLMVFYNPGWFHLLSVDCCCLSTRNYYYSDIGLGMSMIPGGSSNTWDISSDCTTGSLVPYDGVRCISTASTLIDSATGTYSTFVSREHTNAKYYVIVKEDIICVLSGQESSSNLYSGFAIGKIFGTLFNESDNFYYSKYGAFNFASLTPLPYLYERSTLSNSWINSTTESKYSGSEIIGSVFKSTVTTHSITKTDNTTICTAGCIPYTDVGTCINPSSTNATAFTAILVGVITDNTQTQGIVPGSSYKGWLDTDFIRGIYYGLPYNTPLVGGKFIHLGGGIAIGWDPSNTVVLRS